MNEALALLRDHRPDVAVLDANLGRGLAYPIVAQPAAEQIPFVFATGYGRNGISDDWAAWPVVQKPFALATLAAALGPVLRGGRASRPQNDLSLPIARIIQRV